MSFHWWEGGRHVCHFSVAPRAHVRARGKARVGPCRTEALALAHPRVYHVCVVLAKHACEEGLSLTPRFDGAGLLPAIVTDAVSGAVLMLAWMNAEAFDRTLETGEAWF